MAKKSKIDISSNVLVPKHSKLSDKEKEKLLEKYSINFNKLPKILVTDPAISGLEPKEGDVIRIIRPSATAGSAIFYRGVVND